MRKFKIEPEVFDLFPGLQIAVMSFAGINNSGGGRLSLLDQACRTINDKHANLESLHPHIGEYSEAMRKIKRKKGCLASIEAMAKRIVKGDNIGSVNPIVDIYNSVSLSRLFTCGGEDLDCIKGDMVLGFANGDEEFIPLGGREISLPREGELIYHDDRGAIVRSWLWREADRTKITSLTCNALLYMESINQNRSTEFDAAVKELCELVIGELGGARTLHVLSRANPVCDI
jgi:DNA/RNA-binding domain of Phe-tRNA-synthetase-like protein